MPGHTAAGLCPQRAGARSLSAETAGCIDAFNNLGAPGSPPPQPYTTSNLHNDSNHAHRVELSSFSYLELPGYGQRFDAMVTAPTASHSRHDHFDGGDAIDGDHHPPFQQQLGQPTTVAFPAHAAATPRDTEQPPHTPPPSPSPPPSPTPSLTPYITLSAPLIVASPPQTSATAEAQTTHAQNRARLVAQVKWLLAIGVACILLAVLIAVTVHTQKKIKYDHARDLVDVVGPDGATVTMTGTASYSQWWVSHTQAVAPTADELAAAAKLSSMPATAASVESGAKSTQTGSGASNAGRDENTLADAGIAEGACGTHTAAPTPRGSRAAAAEGLYKGSIVVSNCRSKEACTAAAANAAARVGPAATSITGDLIISGTVGLDRAALAAALGKIVKVGGKLVVEMNSQVSPGGWAPLSQLQAVGGDLFVDGNVAESSFNPTSTAPSTMRIGIGINAGATTSASATTATTVVHDACPYVHEARLCRKLGCTWIPPGNAASAHTYGGGGSSSSSSSSSSRGRRGRRGGVGGIGSGGNSGGNSITGGGGGGGGCSYVETTTATSATAAATTSTPTTSATVAATPSSKTPASPPADQRRGVLDLQMDSLSCVGGRIVIAENEGLESLRGLARLQWVGGDVQISENFDLTDATPLNPTKRAGSTVNLCSNGPGLEASPALLKAVNTGGGAACFTKGCICNSNSNHNHVAGTSDDAKYQLPRLHSQMIQVAAFSSSVGGVLTILGAAIAVADRRRRIATESEILVDMSDSLYAAETQALLVTR